MAEKKKITVEASDRDVSYLRIGSSSGMREDGCNNGDVYPFGFGYCDGEFGNRNVGKPADRINYRNDDERDT